jgi:hypothetical protein
LVDAELFCFQRVSNNRRLDKVARKDPAGRSGIDALDGKGIARPERILIVVKMLDPF